MRIEQIKRGENPNMEYSEAIEYIQNTNKFGIKLGLENIKKVLDSIENPHRFLKFVHVAGTNGKGSVVTYLSNILSKAGYKVGVFTSPFIEDFRERISINQDRINEEDLSKITWFVKNKILKLIEEGMSHPTEFELVTAIAIQYFFEKTCDIVLLEVGMGGRFDSTNIIENPLISIITSISYDHMEHLGDTLDKIAYEKAGIIKNECEVLSYPQEKEAEKVISDICKIKKSNYRFISFDKLKILEYSYSGQKFNYNNYNDLEIMLHGNYQAKNAVLAVEAVEILNKKGFEIKEEHVREGLKISKWPGRFEIYKKNPYILLDGGHNLQGIKELTKEIKKYFPLSKKVFIIGIMDNKEYEKMIKILSETADILIVFETGKERAVNGMELFSIAKKYCKEVFFSDKIEGAFNLAKNFTNNEDLICLCGSLYIIGDFKKII
jgi:dihydrofolate synthase/folylpolyglutamate synthase